MAGLFLPFYLAIAVEGVLGLFVLFHGERSRQAFQDFRIRIIMGFCPAVGFIAVLYGNYFGALVALLLFLIFALVFYLRSGMTRQLFHRLLDLACCGSLICFVVAVIQKAVHFSSNPGYRPVSTFLNANYYGMILEFIVLIALYRLSQKTGRRKFYAAVILVNLLGLYLTASMSSFLALACACLVFLLLKGKMKTSFLLMGAAAAALLLATVFPEVFPRIDMIDHTTGQRLDIWSTALKGLEEHPILGQGPMTYLHICDRLGGYYTFHSHNLYLDTLLNYGVIGSLVIFFCAISQMRIIISRLKRNICTSMNLLILAALTAVLVHGLTDVTIFSPQTGLLFLLLCTSMGIQAREKRPVVLVQLPELEPLRRIRWLHARFGRGSGVYSIKR